MDQLTFEQLNNNKNIIKRLNGRNDIKLMQIQIPDQNKQKKIMLYIKKTVKDLSGSNLKNERNYQKLHSEYIAECYLFHEEIQDNGLCRLNIFMECLSMNLEKFFKKIKTKDIKEEEFQNICLYVLLCCLNGLQYLEKQNIGHRDIKPKNIGINRDGKVKLIDFGISRQYNDINDYVQTLIGTLNYQAPEQFNIRGTYKCHKVDIFALGITMYQLIYEQHPYLQEIISNGNNEENKYNDMKNQYSLLINGQKNIKIKNKKFPKINEILEKMLQLQYKQRADIEELLENKAFQKIRINKTKYLSTIKKLLK